MKAVELNELTKRFRERTAVDRLSFSIEQGELFSLLGQNGAGKTTTIRMLSGLLRPTEGDALLMGKSIVTDPEAVRRIINVSPQETAVAPKLTVRENLELIARLYGKSAAEAKKSAEAMLSRFSLADRAKEKAKALSGGLQRRLSIAMALISEPQILFLDEPKMCIRDRQLLNRRTEPNPYNRYPRRHGNENAEQDNRPDSRFLAADALSRSAHTDFPV